MPDKKRVNVSFFQKRKNIFILICVLVCAAICIMFSFYYIRSTADRTKDNPASDSMIEYREEASEPETPLSNSAAATLEPGNLYTGTLREEYQSGEMMLTIPRLDVWSVSVENGTDDDALAQGPGLLLYAQMPSQQNGNVSIAGHRDIHGSLFYYLHNLSQGDYFYLDWQGKVYRYLYEKTYVVEPDDWSPIKTQGYSCLTLLSCHPIGTSEKRIIVVAKLENTAEQSEAYEYKPWCDGLLKPYAWEDNAKSFDKS